MHITVGSAQKVQIGHRPKYYLATVFIGSPVHLRVLRRPFKTASLANVYAVRFARRARELLHDHA